VFLALALSAPQPFGQHPTPQGFVIDRDPILFPQVLGG
jgi:hypothetical protein